jgi:group I intron endonuclease
MVDIIRIYVLKEPDTLKIRYVGMTSKSLKERLRKHLDNALYTKHNPHLCNWILKYYKNNQLPIIDLVEECVIENWQEREKYWITQFNDLLNSTNGGEGSFGFKHNLKSIERIRRQKIGIKQSNETKLKRSKSLKGRIVTEDHKNKISIANKGNIYTKYKLQVTDTINNSVYIFNTVKEVKEYLKSSMTHIRRFINNNKLFKKQYLIIKI